MRVLFVHNNFPGQYRRIAQHLRTDPSFEMVVCTLETNKQNFGLPKIIYKPHRSPTTGIHPVVLPFEESIINAHNAFQVAARALKSKGWNPDLICGHSGWGPTLLLRDLWPDTKMLTYFEWYYNGTDSSFFGDLSDHEKAKLRGKNAAFLADLSIMDWGICPTRFQHSELPRMYRDMVEVLHDGVDTQFYCPEPFSEPVTVGDQTYSPGEEIVTYATRGMEPYRGFPQFMEALARLQKRRPKLRAIIVGEDRAAYGPKRSDGKTFKQHAIDSLDLDLNRIQFTGLLPYASLRAVYRISSVHVYFTVPFVLSWSMIEAMSTGVLLLGSDTGPVREVVSDGVNGLLVDFRDPKQIARRLDDAVQKQASYASLRVAARRTVLDRYDARNLLPCHRQLMVDVASGIRTCR